jgi:multicomponent Na+:H+ antiporter subunit E
MILVFTFAAISVGWALITGGFTVLNLLLGAVVGGIAIYLVRDRSGLPHPLRRLRRILRLIALFAYELFASAIKVGWLVMQPRLKLQPAIVAFPLTAKSDAEITLLANLITLTPGTLSVDVARDRKHLYIHAIDCPDTEALIASIAKGFERRIIEVFS